MQKERLSHDVCHPEAFLSLSDRMPESLAVLLLEGNSSRNQAALIAICLK